MLTSNELTLLKIKLIDLAFAINQILNSTTIFLLSLTSVWPRAVGDIPAAAAGIPGGRHSGPTGQPHRRRDAARRRPLREGMWFSASAG